MAKFKKLSRKNKFKRYSVNEKLAYHSKRVNSDKATENQKNTLSPLAFGVQR